MISRSRAEVATFSNLDDIARPLFLHKLCVANDLWVRQVRQVRLDRIPIFFVKLGLLLEQETFIYLVTHGRPS